MTDTLRLIPALQTSFDEPKNAASSMPEACPWFLLFTQPNHEIRVAENLKRRGFDVYLPTVPEQHRRRIGTYDRPLFARYLFARFDYRERYRILMTPGLTESSIVSFDGTPATLTEADIATVRAIEAEARAPRKAKARGQVVSLQVGGVTLSGVAAGRKRGMDVVILRRAA